MSPKTEASNRRKGTLFATLALGLGILDEALCLTQCSCDDVCSCTRLAKNLAKL